MFIPLLCRSFKCCMPVACVASEFAAEGGAEIQFAPSLFADSGACRAPDRVCRPPCGRERVGAKAIPEAIEC